MSIVYNTPESYLNAVESEFQESPSKMANRLGIHPSHLYNYYSGSRGVSPALRKALRKKGLMKKRIRSQVSWESEEQKETALRYVQHRGFKNLTAFLRSIGDGDVAGNGYDKQDILF